MIHIDLSWAISIFLFSTISLVIGRWIFYNYSEEKAADETKHLQQCPYCTYLFFDYEEATLKICPRCESYITPEDFEVNPKTTDV